MLGNKFLRIFYMLFVVLAAQWISAFGDEIFEKAWAWLMDIVTNMSI